MSSPTPLTIDQVMAKFPTKVRDRYDFTGATYAGALIPIFGIVCPDHGEFRQYAAQLRKDGGAHCPKCGDIVRRAKKRLSMDELLAKMRAVHGDRYGYDKVQYRSQMHKVTVTCPDHGDFQIMPVNHFKGQGCPTCGAAKRGYRKSPGDAARKSADSKLAAARAAFEAEARVIHGDAYDYSRADYQGRRKRLTILCPAHGPFEQVAEKHLARAQGCPECSHHRSKGEAQLAAYMGIFADVRSRDRSLIAPKELDIYAAQAALAVEYCGEYWHGARNAEEEPFARRRHLEKQLACEERGVRLLTVFESEWLSRPHAIKRLIRNKLGKARGKLMARKCEVTRVGPVAAYDFFERFHPQGGAGSGEHFGLYHRGKLVACMRFTLGSNDRGRYAERDWTLSRYATRIAVSGGASRLMAAFVAEFAPAVVKSFSDNRYFSGAMYEKLGFELEEELPPDYQVYHIKTGLLSKSAWQRKKIPARIRELGAAEVFDPRTDPRSERTMTYLLGARRVYDCGKKRWVWRKPI